MSYNYQGSIQHVITSYLDQNLDLSTARDTISISQTTSLTDGIGSGAAQLHMSDEVILGTAGAASGTYILDLQNATGPYGSQNYSRVKYAYVHLDSDTSGLSVHVGSANSAAALLWHGITAGYTVIEAGGIHTWLSPVDGYTISASNHNLRFYNPSESDSITVQFVLAGEGS